MKGIAILLLVIASLFSIYQMIDSNKSLQDEWFKNLDRSNKIKVTKDLKSFWKGNIILIALMIGIFLISTFKGLGNRYESILIVVSIIFATISTVISILKRKQYNDNINEFIS